MLQALLEPSHPDPRQGGGRGGQEEAAISGRGRGKAGLLPRGHAREDDLCRTSLRPAAERAAEQRHGVGGEGQPGAWGRLLYFCCLLGTILRT